MSSDALATLLRRALPALAACLLTAPAIAQHGAMTVPRNLDQLTDRASDIVRGTVVAASGVSGNKFRFYHGNPITNPDPDFFGPFRSENPSHIGSYEIPLPPGDYMIHVESIQPEFTAGSSVGADIVIAMPGASPGPIGPVTVAAGVASEGTDVTLVGTPPRFDQFEGP